MSAAWVAGSVRGRLLLGRRLGTEGARSLASCGSLEDALAELAGTAYAPAAAAGSALETAQRAIAAVTLFELRMLAGWLPRSAVELVRALAAWFELANVEDRLDYLLGGDLRQPYDLGALAVAWPRVALAQSPAELRAALASSVWGDPRSEDPAEIHLALRIGWARRVLAVAPEAAAWADAAAGLLLAREAAAAARAPAPRAEMAGDLWTAEAAWWHAVEREAEPLARGPREGRGVVVGAAALLGLDAVRVTAALAVAARGGTPAAREALDALL